MPYSAVTQPRAWPLSHGGSRSSSVAVTRTWVSPNFTKHEPSAYFTTPRSSDTARSSSGCRRLGRMGESPQTSGNAGWRLFRWQGWRPQGRIYRAVICLRRRRRIDNFTVPGASMSQDVPIGATQVSLAQLNERSREIFRQIVESYLATGEPVGSRNISRLITTPLSPASVRNVMSDLEQLGLVYAP